MALLFIVLPAALLLAAVAIFAFVWAVRSGQMDDLNTPAIRALHDDQPASRHREPRSDDVNPSDLHSDSAASS